MALTKPESKIDNLERQIKTGKLELKKLRDEWRQEEVKYQKLLNEFEAKGFKLRENAILKHDEQVKALRELESLNLEDESEIAFNKPESEVDRKQKILELKKMVDLMRQEEREYQELLFKFESKGFSLSERQTRAHDEQVRFLRKLEEQLKNLK